MLKDLVNNTVKNQNLYTIPQYLLIILIYYLMFNAIFNSITNLNINVDKIVPEIILTNNDKLKILLDEWMPFVGLLGVVCFIAGFLIDGLKHIPYISGFKAFHESGISWYIAPWLIIGYAFFVLYNFNQFIFMFSISIIFIIVQGSKELLKDKKF